ncbi:heavy metal translocating P-type ATPase [Polymorphum gilvum]|uniref:Nitrogen fixation protein fixI calcium ATPase, transmembrane domain n=1 Tax=Polymorphum gilvum (strain LMG 25793 / CGMCC 1.9160 / SL003B-26A1) TaxID=991905 RepID=F2IXK5_POLGS|nr:heavy metal translocating P-type ATPase [Polymorphum gilvum]ADZ71628.1 Nitrogen fixation protein fixI; calcium ATPase, transmembrane domain [Polymorphum gilvum SL003B-26A1]
MTVHMRDWESFVTPAEDGSVRMDLAVEGITCAACMSEIERGLARLPGIAHARVNLTSQRLAVAWRAEETGAEDIVAALDRMGYRAHPFDPAAQKERQDRDGRELLRAMAVAGFAGMNIMLLSISVWSGNVTDITPETRDLFHWVSAIIALPTVAYSGRPFLRSALAALGAGRLNMDVPIVIGVTLAVGLSFVQTMQSQHHAYFESAVMLLFFLLVGRYLDHNMRRRTRSLAENIAALKAEVAARIGADGAVREVPLSKIEPGDLVLVTAGERIPVDGIVEFGRSEIDQSLVTGETALQPVGAGERVYAGTLNADGVLKVRVSAASGATLLDEVNRLLEAAAQAKSTYVRLADKAAAQYSPLVHGAAALTFLGWILAGLDWQPALVIAISVLIITCPCALGLAIPAVQVVASGQLFRSSVLINSGDAIERLAAADTIVFDKTGTLTLAEPQLIEPAVPMDAVLDLAGRLALSSKHPLALALARAVGADRPLDGVVETTGAGVEAVHEGLLVRLGSPAFCGVDEAAVAEALARHPDASLLALRIGEAAPRLLPMRQSLRPDAAATVAALRARGYRIEILSGDRAGAVDTAARALGIADWRAGLTPADKIARLEELKADGRCVLMVGDGLNDAPALAGAHVSLSPVTAVHLSQAAADAVFLGDRLAPVAEALAIARKAKTAMMQNLWISVIYNFIAVPIAVAGYVTPLIAALAMSGSSIIVTANALRLRLGAGK